MFNLPIFKATKATKAPPTPAPGAAVSSAAASAKRRIGELRQGARRAGTRDSDDSVRARVRMTQYATLMRGLPLSLGGMLVLATAIAALSPGIIDDALLLGWLVGMCTLTLAGLQAWWRWRRAETAARVPLRRLRLATGLAGLAGALWGSVPALIYLRAGLAQQQFIAPVLIGMLGAGTFTLAALAPATAAFAGTLSLGMVTALALSSGAGHLWILLGWLVFLAIGAASALAHARDLQARTAAEVRNDDQQQLISLLLRDFEDSGSDALWEIDPRGCLVQPSKRLADALGSARKELDGRPLRELLSQLQRGLPDMERESADQLTQRLTEGQPFRDVLLPLMLGGQARWWSVTAKPLLDERGAALGWRGVARDVTQSRVADRKLSWLAHYDTLTGLINRAQLRILLEHAISGKADDRDSARGTLLCLDLDNFKTVNDTLGHATGDALLVEVARRLKAAVSKIDVVARLGGDEFAVLLRHQSDEAEVRGAAARIIDSLRAPCEAQGAAVAVRTSIGVARFPQDGSSVDELMQHADLALHEAKAESNGAIRLFEPSMGEQVRRRLVLERDLRLAIEAKQLSLHFQPKIDLARWRVTGFEALLRWNHPQHGAIPPSEFVRVAEDSGLIIPMGEWALEEACRQAATWPQDLHVAVNISPVQVMAQNLPATVSRLLKAARLEPKRLELEITESVFLNEGSGTAERLHALRKLGVRIALDDFGTGSSSLAYLRRFPFDTLKIDRAFIRELMVSREARSIVRNILALAKSMRMATVAEGVEEPAQIKLLDSEGCSAVQGFYIAKPMPATEIERFIIDWREDRKPVSRRSRSSSGAAHAGSAKAGQGAAASAATPAPAPTGDTAARSAPSRPERSAQRSTEAV
jgi:diguanylate cyclase (GGDEF)-like protein/PAS domain S-box-containing protein